MSAFGRRPGTAGRPAFGVAKPMQTGPGMGGSQFPAIDTPAPEAPPSIPSNLTPEQEAMERLNQRSTAEMAEPEKAQGFEASVHKIKEQVLPRLLERVDPEAAATLSKDELTEEFRPIILEVLAALRITLNRREQFALEKVLVDELLGLGPLEELLSDPNISDIMVNGPDAVFVERRGQIGRAAGFRDSAHLAAVLERLAGFAGKPSSDSARPVVEGRLPDASRFVIVSPPLAPSGPLCTITRRLPPTSTLDDLVGREALSRPMATLLRAAARGRLNILVSGRAESGRTSMLSALARAIAPGERVVTVERRPELRLDLGNVVSLVAPEAGPEMVPAIDLSLAIAAASRLRPDRLVIDGLGNGAVAALVTLIDGGRDGVVASCEANSPRAALEELARRITETEPQETLATAQKRIVGAFDLVVHLDAFRDGRWRVTHITEVAGADGESIAGHDLFYYDHVSSRPDGRFVSAGHQSSFLPRLAKLGLDEGLVDPA